MLLTILLTDDIYLKDAYRRHVLKFKDIQQMSMKEFEDLVSEYDSVLIDSRLTDLICMLSYYINYIDRSNKSASGHQLDLFVLYVAEYDNIMTFYQYMNNIWFNNQYRLFDNNQLSNVLTTILILDGLKQTIRIDIITAVVQAHNSLIGKYNIEILISLLNNNPQLLQQLLKQRDFNIHLDYNSVKKLVGPYM